MLRCAIDSIASVVRIVLTVSTSMQVYALATALCVASAKTTKRSGSEGRDGRDENAPATDAMATDDAIEPLDEGPSFGRLVVDGCCHAFAEALRKVPSPLFGCVTLLCSKRCVALVYRFCHGRVVRSSTLGLTFNSVAFIFVERSIVVPCARTAP